MRLCEIRKNVRKKELSSRKIKVYNTCLGSEREVKVGTERDYF